MPGNQRFQVQPNMPEGLKDDQYEASGRSPQVSFNMASGNYNTVEQPSKFKASKRNDLDRPSQSKLLSPQIKGRMPKSHLVAGTLMD